MSNGQISHELAPQFGFLDLADMRIDLDGKYYIILEGNDNIGISIVEKDTFVVVDPYAKEYLEDAKPFDNNETDTSYNSLKMYNESIVEKYIEPYYFLKLAQDHPGLQEDWLAANQHRVNITIDAWSFSRFMAFDLRSEEAKIKFLHLQDVLQHINTILNTLPKPLAFSQIKLGFDKLACEQESIEMLKDKQICIDLHDLFWDLFPELLSFKLKSKIMRDNQYMQRAFFLNSNN
ncbi:MAG TPA: hypothetical protein PKC21_05695 [Oligoflexia bacterium]|nr:hypothetical protein [Oligoflexia bacterium]HMR24828.1 hypothetical protein [Oligoflexia bacterium]